MTEEQINAIRKLFFQRVEDSLVRTRIIQLASVLSDTDTTEGEEAMALDSDSEIDNRAENDFYSAIYYYSLPEHRNQFEKDYTEFILDA